MSNFFFLLEVVTLARVLFDENYASSELFWALEYCYKSLRQKDTK